MQITDQGHVILSEAKNLWVAREILRCAQDLNFVQNRVTKVFR